MDIKAILAHTFQRTDIDRSKIFIHGRSLGGATCVYGVTETNYDIKGVINYMFLIDFFTNIHINIVDHRKYFLFDRKYDETLYARNSSIF